MRPFFPDERRNALWCVARCYSPAESRRRHRQSVHYSLEILQLRQDTAIRWKIRRNTEIKRPVCGQQNLLPGIPRDEGRENVSIYRGTDGQTEKWGRYRREETRRKGKRDRKGEKERETGREREVGERGFRSNAVMENRWPGERRIRKLLQSVLGFPLAGRTDRDIVIFIRPPRAVFPNFRRRTRWCRITRGRVRVTRFSIRYGLERWSIRANSIRFSRFSLR